MTPHEHQLYHAGIDAIQELTRTLRRGHWLNKEDAELLDELSAKAESITRRTERLAAALRRLDRQN